jgi:hypothetical protein
MSNRDEDENTNRFTITDYTDGYGYGGDEDEEASNVKPTTSNNAHVAKLQDVLLHSNQVQSRGRKARGQKAVVVVAVVEVEGRFHLRVYALYPASLQLRPLKRANRQ